jgi:hypothetical protein
MARHDRQTWDTSPNLDETRASLDDLIRPGLSRAFPLPDGSHVDERFARLLEALAQVSTEPSHGARIRQVAAL